jgi:hypothetical protein
VQKIVRLGYAPYIFKVGDQLTCNHETFGPLVWDIIDFDHDIPNDQTKTHSMTLQLHNVLDINYRGFDCAEALFQVQEDLEPGNYYLSYNAKIDNSGTTSVLMFTIPQGTTIPAGSLCVNASATGGTSWIFIPDAFSKNTVLCTVTMRVTTL